MLRQSVPGIRRLWVARPKNAFGHVHPSNMTTSHADGCCVELVLRMQQQGPGEWRMVRVGAKPFFLWPSIAFVDDDHIGRLGREITGRGVGPWIAHRRPPAVFRGISPQFALVCR